MPEQCKKKPYSSPFWSLSVAIIGVLCIFLIPEDAFSWGVPGKAAPGSGQGPGGGARSGSAPAPFGFMFLFFGTGIAALFAAKIKQQLLPFIPTFMVLIAGVGIDDISPVLTFLLSVPLVALTLRYPFKDGHNQTLHYSITGLLLFGIFSPLTLTLTPYLMSLAVLLCVVQTKAPRATSLLLAAGVTLPLFALQPYAQFGDAILQSSVASLTTTALLFMGFIVEQHGTTIVGLKTTINISKACVGSEILATTSVLCAFLSVLFVPHRRQIRFFVQTLAIVFILNTGRVLCVTLLSHYLLHIEFDRIHFHTGWFTALFTYGLMAIVTYLSHRAPQDCGGQLS